MEQVFNIQIWWVFWYYYSLSIFFQTKIKTQAPVTIIDANFDLNDPNEEYQKCQEQILSQGMKN